MKAHPIVTSIQFALSDKEARALVRAFDRAIMNAERHDTSLDVERFSSFRSCLKAALEGVHAEFEVQE